MATRLQFLQLSDVHLDSPLSGGRLTLPPEKATRRRKELCQVFAAALDLARQRAVDVILLPGDLFDVEAVTDDTVNFVIDALAAGPPIPLVLTPGNHDPLSRTSPYAAALRARRGQPPWPEHVLIVQEPHFTAFRHPMLPHVSFTGMAYDRNRPIEQRLLADPLPRLEAEVQILIFHGSRDLYAPHGKRITLPFSDEELAAQSFHYAAIGHYHSYAAIEHGGRILGCYAGCPAGRNLGELGKKTVLLGDVLVTDDEVRVEVEPIRLDRREVGRVEISVDGVTHGQALMERVQHGLAGSGYSRDDLLLVELVGRLPRGIDATVPAELASERFFHVVFDSSGVKPDYDLEVYLREGLSSTEGRFAREMKARLDGETDPARRRLIENALYYGLDALVLKEVVPRYED
jgi:DNA repair exonuclease SbcCD nuclease subunit